MCLVAPDLESYWEAHDFDNSGYMEICELFYAYYCGGPDSIGPPNAEDLMQMFDKSPKDCKLSFNEFEELVDYV